VASSNKVASSSRAPKVVASSRLSELNWV
jgi:hypothetical protein